MVISTIKYLTIYHTKIIFFSVDTVSNTSEKPFQFSIL